MEIRLAEKRDYQKILDILNEAIEERESTATLTKVTMEGRKEWFARHSCTFQPIFVAEEDDEVIGWFSLTEFRSGREGFRYTSEISYYIHPDARGKGVGSAMMAYTIEAARNLGFKRLLAIIFETNTHSKNLAQKYGFQLWGRLPGIIDIDGKEIDCDYWGLKL